MNGPHFHRWTLRPRPGTDNGTWPLGPTQPCSAWPLGRLHPL